MLKQSVSNLCMMCPPSAFLGSSVALLLLKYCEPPPLTPEFGSKGLEGFSREDFRFLQCLVKACPSSACDALWIVESNAPEKKLVLLCKYVQVACVTGKWQRDYVLTFLLPHRSY